MLLSRAIAALRVLESTGAACYLFYPREEQRVYVGLARVQLVAGPRGVEVREGTSAVRSDLGFFETLRERELTGFFLSGGEFGHADRPLEALFLLPALELVVDAEGAHVTVEPPGDSKLVEEALAAARADTHSALPEAPRLGRELVGWSSEPDAAFEERLAGAIELVRGRSGKLIVTRCFERARKGSLSPLNLLALLAAAEPQAAALHFVRCGTLTSLGTSPENVMELTAGELTLDAVAGTRPVSLDPAQDARYLSDLLGSEKERAEHALALGRAVVAAERFGVAGSVRVGFERSVRQLRAVRHLHSRVHAKLAPDWSSWRLLRAAHPPLVSYPDDLAGRFQPAPTPSTFHGGLVGRVTGALDLQAFLNLRCLELAPERLLMQAGVGVVDTAELAGERKELLAKLRSLADCVAQWEAGS